MTDEELKTRLLLKLAEAVAEDIRSKASEWDYVSRLKASEIEDMAFELRVSLEKLGDAYRDDPSILERVE